MPKPGLKVFVEDRGEKAAEVALEGSVDAHTFDLFCAAMGEQAEAATLWIVLDISKMIYIASVGLNYLVNCRVVQRKLGGEMIVVGPQPQVMTILKMLGLTEVLVLAKTPAEAWEKIRNTPRTAPWPDRD